MTVIATPDAPRALGPYSQGRTYGELLFTAGQIGLIPATMALAEGPEAQIRQVLANIRAIVTAAGGNTDSILKLTVYLLDLAHWPLVNDAIEAEFSAPYPARTAVGVASLPLGGMVEIEAVAAIARPEPCPAN
ncbi:RidA family protein [Frigidibacter albus]|uniref:RidA family protein n=1 Tax=Frigidibacter albus TaxID=1465486 RepID=A0A6L8VG27_9RHOB|nr:Rid family detoxifying hydrolase [Frigidibacter albus]MZQ89265.1 RidA family protein [Frigidibacter albus]NBE31171.1 RidA family protein [Frigidibacter albus]GGH53279.1 reactive intermediate/imine deaminase [Frigidibacter albus]